LGKIAETGRKTRRSPPKRNHRRPREKIGVPWAVSRRREHSADLSGGRFRRRRQVVLGPRKQGPDDVLLYLADGNTRLLSQDLGGSVWPGPEWRLFRKDERVPARPDINDGIAFSRPESSSALVYWGNGGFRI